MCEPSLYYPYIKWHSALQSRERHSTIFTTSCSEHSTLHPVVRHSELRTTFCSETRSTRDFKCISLKCISLKCISLKCISASVWSEGPVITRINNMWNMECWVRTTGWSAECWVPHYFLLYGLLSAVLYSVLVSAEWHLTYGPMSE